jgi:hypothetical protein
MRSYLKRANSGWSLIMIWISIQIMQTGIYEKHTLDKKAFSSLSCHFKIAA